MTTKRRYPVLGILAAVAFAAGALILALYGGSSEHPASCDYPNLAIVAGPEAAAGGAVTTTIFRLTPAGNSVASDSQQLTATTVLSSANSQNTITLAVLPTPDANGHIVFCGAAVRTNGHSQATALTGTATVGQVQATGPEAVGSVLIIRAYDNRQPGSPDHTWAAQPPAV